MSRQGNVVSNTKARGIFGEKMNKHNYGQNRAGEVQGGA